MKRYMSRVDRDETAATAVEYAIMVVLIAVVIILAVLLLGQQVKSDFDCTGSVIDVPENATNCG